MVEKVADIHVASYTPLPQPAELAARLPKKEEEARFVSGSRRDIHRILFGDDRRLLMVVGPCSIHDVEAGLEYGRRLAALARAVSDRLMLVMRVYFEKPRTTIGWKGLIMDPHLDGSCDIESGLFIARSFLRDIIDLGLPTATELLDPVTPQYIADLICWSAIGARTTESQTHRQMASGLSMPLGFKNGTDGNIGTAINAIKAARVSQTFLGINHEGRASAVTTRGNPHCHLILRGGTGGPNFDEASVAHALQLLREAGLPPILMIDASHANSLKDPANQPKVGREVIRQVMAGNASIIGLMMESNLEAGNQPFPQPKKSLRRGVSITDSCIGWSETEDFVLQVHRDLAPRFA